MSAVIHIDDFIQYIMKLHILQSDITQLTVDAIVNAANSSLMGGGGVDGAIHRAGGPVILEECRKIIARQGGCKTGEAVITTSGNMPAKFVIHTVGPVWNGGNNEEADKLSNCYKNSLRLAVENNCRTVAFPNISTGIYGYPKKQAAGVAVTAVKDFIKDNNTLDKVIFICFDKENFDLYKNLLGSNE